jgi:poly-gamma-glutamate synthesis protein (capsule biosynthesis protein)
MKLTTPSQRALWLALLASLGLVVALFAACSGAESPAATPTPTRTPRPTETPIPSPTPTPAWPVTVFVPPGLPAPVADTLNAALTGHPDLFAPAPSAEAADVQVMLSPDPGTSLLAEWVYAVVAPFPTLTDEVAWADVASTWSGTLAGPFAGRPLLMSAETAAALATVLGEPVPTAMEIVAPEEILPRAWDFRPSWAIVPFDQLEPRWKVLRLDGQSVLDKDLDTAAYPLVVRAGLAGLERGVAKLQELLAAAPLTNRDPAQMTVLVMTGVTALTRGTAVRMEANGVTYPAQDIRDWLLDADITHVSSEVSFAGDCPPPASNETMVFCSSPRYVELLEDVDVDVIELTGNHLLDWGVEPMRLSLTMYDERGLSYFGGGWNLAQAQSVLTLTHGVHTFGFAGCNPVGPASDWATDSQPGAAPCNYDALYAQVHQLRDQGIIPIVTQQYWEFYQYEPTPQQRSDFRALAEAGAVIVSGSQAHQPQGFDFYDGAFIHYGLGNLFFDQMWSLETRQEFVDRHVFYDGRHLSTEVLTAILEDYARPRPMAPEEREALLSAAFAASGW